MIHAQTGAFWPASLVDVAVMLSVVLWIVILAGPFYTLYVFRVSDWTGDNVSTTGPFPEVNQAATLTAKREIGIVAQDNFPASRTAQAGDALFGHMDIVLDDQRGLLGATG
jgi:hypothetical protein